ncbi:extracellular solute-binding protein [Streptomyces albidoflavus]|uniref:extracellular solute-binding protein n=1 Tax=Streptomyces albidoflavus TaxID=1886 RepID=UPI00101E51F2|nr:extracellular solute-binding protein [Streptomyces albidoflavus]RZD86738.1 ABC transporter substrate-binding protein [Streptomyces albidoflavus]
MRRHHEGRGEGRGDRRDRGAARSATALAVVLALAAALAGCGSDSAEESADEEVALRLVAPEYGDSAKTSSKGYWKRVVASFEKGHPGTTVDVEVHPWRTVDKVLARQVAAGNAPDLAISGTYASYAADGQLYRADDLVSIGTQADFLPPLARAGEMQRVQYGMPFAASTRLLFYNRDLFEEAGLTPPKTWDGVRGAAEALKKRDVPYPYALPLGPEEAQAETLNWLLSGGSGYTDDLGSYTLDSPENVETVGWLKKELVGEGLTGPTPPGELDRADAYAAFAKGRVGMVNGHPSLMRAAERSGVRYGVAPVPGRTEDTGATLGVTDWMIGFRQAGHPEEAGAFLDHVYSEKNVLAFTRAHDLLPVTHTASDTLTAAPGDTTLRRFLAELPEARLYPSEKTSWPELSTRIKSGLADAVAPGGSPKAVLSRLQRHAAAYENPQAGNG